MPAIQPSPLPRPITGSQEELAQAQARSRLLNRLAAASITLALLLLALLFASLQCDLGGGPQIGPGTTDDGAATGNTDRPPVDPAGLYFLLRFVPSDDDPAVVRPAFARLTRPNGGEVKVIDGWANGTPDEQEFYDRLRRVLASEKGSWPKVTRILIEDTETPTGESTVTQPFRRAIERLVATPFPDFRWIKTSRLNRMLARGGAIDDIPGGSGTGDDDTGE